MLTEAAPSILLAEDDAEMRALLADALRQDGYRVEEAETGGALARAIAKRLETRHELPLDLIVSDVRLPGLSGLDVIGALRSVDWSVPVVVMTAFGDDEVRAEALRLGAVAVLDKPFTIDSLKGVIRRALGPKSPAASRRP